jgi:protein transport protein SEC31
VSVSPASVADIRFNRLAWSAPNASHSRGVLAAGMETGEVNVFDPEKIISGAG